MNTFNGFCPMQFNHLCNFFMRYIEGFFKGNKSGQRPDKMNGGHVFLRFIKFEYKFIHLEKIFPYLCIMQNNTFQRQTY